MLINPDKIIRLLEEHFPDTLPDKHISVEELRFLQGNQKVVRYVRSLVESLEEEALTNVHGRP